MASNYNFQSPSPQMQYQSQSFFPQPQGSVYLINNSMEVANIPMSAGVSAAICMNEEVVYLKAMQNGNPMLMAVPAAEATISLAAVTDIANVSFSTIIKVLPSCTIIDNLQTLTLSNTGLEATYSNINIVITKLC